MKMKIIMIIFFCVEIKCEKNIYCFNYIFFNFFAYVMVFIFVSKYVNNKINGYIFFEHFIEIKSAGIIYNIKRSKEKLKYYSYSFYNKEPIDQMLILIKNMFVFMRKIIKWYI